MGAEDDLSYLYRIAKYYYDDGMIQSEIAEAEGVSRSLVSKLLDRAREVGVVKVTLELPTDPSLDAVEAELQERLGLKGVFIAPSSSLRPAPDQALRNALAVLADPIRSLIAKGRILGVGWGKTLYSLASEMPAARHESDLIVVPLLDNAIGLNQRYLQTSTVVSHFSAALQADAYYYNSPNYAVDSDLYAQLAEVNSQQISRLWDTMDVAIFGTGQTSAGMNRYLTKLSPEFMKIFEKTVGVGTKADVLGLPIYGDGSIDYTPNTVWRNGVDVTKLRSLDVAICIAIGPDKVGPLSWVAKSGFANYIATDYDTARSMIGFLDRIDAGKSIEYDSPLTELV